MKMDYLDMTVINDMERPERGSVDYSFGLLREFSVSREETAMGFSFSASASRKSSIDITPFVSKEDASKESPVNFMFEDYDSEVPSFELTPSVVSTLLPSVCGAGLPVVNASNAMPVVNASSALPVVNASSALPVVNASSTLPVVNASSALPVVNASNAMPVVNASSALPVVNASSAMPVVNASSALPVVNASNAMPVVNTNNASPVVNASMPVLNPTNALPIISNTSTAPILPTTLQPIDSLIRERLEDLKREECRKRRQKRREILRIKRQKGLISFDCPVRYRQRSEQANQRLRSSGRFVSELQYIDA